MRRHHYLAVGAIITLCCLSILVMSLFKIATAEDSNNNLLLPPTAPVGIVASYTGSGVKLDWQAAQSGTYPIKQYHIWRQAEGADFSEIATATNDSTTYSDADGIVGDHYKLTAEDDQAPPNISTDSEAVAAAEPPKVTAKIDLPSQQVDTPQVTILPPGTTIQNMIVPNTTALTDQINNGGPKPNDTNSPTTTPANTTPNKASPASPSVAEVKPSDVLNTSQADTLIQSSGIRTAQLEGAISVSNDPVIQPILVRYSYEKQVLYQHYDQLQPAQKATAKDGCQQDIPSLETSILNLPEALQINAVVAMASCQLVLNHP